MQWPIQPPGARNLESDQATQSLKSEEVPNSATITYLNDSTYFWSKGPHRQKPGFAIPVKKYQLADKVITISRCHWYQYISNTRCGWKQRLSELFWFAEILYLVRCLLKFFNSAVSLTWKHCPPLKFVELMPILKFKLELNTYNNK